MSLNGLDAAQVNEAFEAAIAEVGGWFLLKYATRDEVEVLSKGAGGLAEVKDTIKSYKEKSPLYGLLVYRKKKVLLKYVPDGTSRLLQARLAVHQQSIIERFPHDAIVPLTNATQLTETTLSSSTSLLKSSSSIKSSESLKRQRRLTEIAEDVAEVHTQNSANSQQDTAETIPIPSEESSGSLNSRQCVEHTSNVPIVSDSQSAEAHRRSLSGNKPLPETPEERSKPLELEEQSFRGLQPDTRPILDHRYSSQSGRPAPGDSYIAYGYKPKVKLGPRPTAGSDPSQASTSVGRSVALPAGLRMSSRSTKTPSERPKTQQDTSKPFFFQKDMTLAVPATSMAMKSGVSNRPLSVTGSVASISSTTHFSESNESAITPEKQRLMKALQKRKNNQMAKMASAKNESAHGKTTQKDEPTAELDRPKVLSISVDNLTSPRGAASKSDNHSTLSHKSQSTDASTLSPVDASTESDTKTAITDNSNMNIHTGQSKLADEKNTPKPDLLGSCNSPEQELDGVFWHEYSHSISSDDALKSRNSIVTTQPRSPSFTEPRVDDSFQTRSHLPSQIDAQSNPSEIALPPVDQAEADFYRHTGLGESNDLAENHVLSPEEGTLAPFQDISLSHQATLSPAQEQTPLSHDSNTPTQKDAAFELEVKEVDLSLLTEPNHGKVIDSVDTSETNSLSDDSLMEELRSATFQEAKHVTVSKSPITPFFPASPKSSSSKVSSDGGQRGIHSASGYMETKPFQTSPPVAPFSSISSFTQGENSYPARPTPSRSTPSPIDSRVMPNGLDVSEPVGALPIRTSSISPTERIEPSLDAPKSKKGGVSSLISQKIRALERFSSAPSQPSTMGSAVTTALVTQRKGSLTTPPSSSGGEPSRRMGSIRKETHTSPTPIPRGNIFQRQLPYRTDSSDKTKDSDLVSLRATINRSSSGQAATRSSVTQDQQAVNLLQSPLHVDHSKASSFFSKGHKKTPKAVPDTVTTPSSPRDSMKSMKRDSFSGRRSTSSRKESFDTVRPSSPTPDGSSSPEKKGSKKPGLLKRMSALTFAPRRSIAQALSPTLNDQPIIERHEPNGINDWHSTMPIGDVNIQFPDTLLWKRRHMEIDTHGFIVLSASRFDQGFKIATKRYHISGFQLPHIPDPDREELAHSVVLDFKDGSTLQCACEDSVSQISVLKELVAAHTAFQTVNDPLH